MNTTIPAPPRQRLRDLVRNHRSNDTCRRVLDALDTPRPHGRMRDWMLLNHGHAVTTIQVSPMGAWAPTDRTIDAKTRSGAVALDDSWREYAGMRVVHAGSDVLIVESADTAVAYILNH